MYDTCAAFIALAKSDDALGKVVNAASEFEISIADTASLISEVMNIEMSIETDEERVRPEASEVNRLFGDSSLLQSLTDWKPKYAGRVGFKKGLSITAEWFSQPSNLALYRPGSYMI